MTIHVTVTLIRDLERGDPPATDRVRRDLAPSLAGADVAVQGVYLPVSGLPRNELYLVTTAREPHDVVDLGPFGLNTLDSHGFVPVTGTDLIPPDAGDGIVVFHWFEARSGDVERIVELSAAARPSSPADLGPRVLALLRRPTEARVIKMLLMTRYADLAEWEQSSRPAGMAGDPLPARADLVRSARPVVTRAAA